MFTDEAFGSQQARGASRLHDRRYGGHPEQLGQAPRALRFCLGKREGRGCHIRGGGARRVGEGVGRLRGEGAFGFRLRFMFLLLYELCFFFVVYVVSIWRDLLRNLVNFHVRSNWVGLN